MERQRKAGGPKLTAIGVDHTAEKIENNLLESGIETIISAAETRGTCIPPIASRFCSPVVGKSPTWAWFVFKVSSCREEIHTPCF
jgi:hypothetical protein